MKGQDALFSRVATGGKDEWATPPDLFAALDAEFDFTIDAAADESNHLCDRYYGPGGSHDDALALHAWRHDRDASSRVWLNPPYSRGAAFVKKARAEADAGNALVVLLLPARTDVRWFHDYVYDTARRQARERTEIRFLRGRLKFSGAAQSAPFPSMIVIFKPKEVADAAD